MRASLYSRVALVCLIVISLDVLISCAFVLEPDFPPIHQFLKNDITKPPSPAYVAINGPIFVR